MKGTSMHRYGCMSLLLDLIMIVITGGLWIFWIMYRQIQK